MSRHYDLQLRDQYKSETFMDELAFYLGVDFTDLLVLKPQWEGLVLPPTDPNHIWTNPRRDLWSNLICLTNRAHRAFHKRITEGRVLCMLAKARKAERIGNPKELDLAELDLCCGRSVCGVVDGWSFDDARMEKWRLELLQRMADVGAKE